MRDTFDIEIGKAIHEVAQIDSGEIDEAGDADASNDDGCPHRADDWVTDVHGQFICPKCSPELLDED